MVELQSEISFEHMLAHMFPGFFTAITVFMILDLVSSLDISAYIFKDLNALLGFFGAILLGGTILGIIIDGIHHYIIEQIYFEKYMMEGQNGVKSEEIVKHFREQHCEVDCPKGPVFNWKNFNKDDKIKLREFLRNKFNIYWIETYDFIKTEKTISASYKNNNILLELESNATKVILSVNGRKRYEFIKDKMDNIYTNECPFNRDLPYKLMKIFYLFDVTQLDEYIEVFEYHRKEIYHYYEFFANTFIAMIPFTLVAPLYLMEEIRIDWWQASLLAAILALTEIVCLYLGLLAYKRYVAALYFSFCRCTENKKQVKRTTRMTCQCGIR
jgi:hypothetical protein